MEIDNKNLAETFSASSNDSDPSIGEIRKKIKHKKSNNDVTTYKVVAYIMANKKIEKDKNIKRKQKGACNKCL